MKFEFWMLHCIQIYFLVVDFVLTFKKYTHFLLIYVFYIRIYLFFFY